MKKKYQKIVFILVASSLFTLSINAQVKTKIYQTEVPLEIVPTKNKIEKVRKIDTPPDFNNLKQKAKDSKLIETENKFAEAVLVNIDILKEGNENIEGRMLMYSLAIKSDEALNLSVQFEKFHLSKNAVLSIYTKNEITDRITEKENSESNIWATRVYQGNILFIVLKLPSEEKKEVSLKINKVNLGYKPFGIDFGNIGASAPCHINANCPAGVGWDNEKNTIALIVANGQEACTGSLLMNTCNTNIPYFLTANHCLDAGNIPNWVFQFQTLSTDCATNTGWREDVQFNGCTLRANNAASDFALLQLNTTPPANSGIFYSGWSRQTTGNTSTTVLHHPAGDLMKISVDNGAPTSLISLGVDVWQIDQDLGRLQGGSSGAPYYNQNHQIIGQHWRRPEAGTRPICDITVAQGGRFDRSWTGDGTNTTRLSNWLDLSNTGLVMTTNTTNVANLSATLSIPTVTGYYTVNSGTTQTSISNDTYQQIYVPRSSTVTVSFFITTNNFLTYNWSYDNVTASGLQFVANFTAPANGYSSITKNVYLDANDGCSIVRRTYTFNINSLGWSFSVATSPNPTSDKLNVSITKIKKSNGKVINEITDEKQTNKPGKTIFRVYSINTSQLMKQWAYNEADLMNYSLDIKGLKPGMYVLKMERDGQTTISKILVQ